MAKESHILRNIFNVIVIIANVLVALGLIVSAYSGYLAQEQWRFAPLAVMTFFAWYIAIIAIFVLDLIWWKRTAIIAGVAIIVCAPQMWDFSPLNLPRPKMTEQQRSQSFTVMSYNVMQFSNQNKERQLFTNEQLDYILDQSPDVVCIQEARCFASNGQTHIIPEQLQSLSDEYKYIYIKGEDLSFLSKYEATPIPLDYDNDINYGSLGLWRLDVDGMMVNVFVVHLTSYKFSIEEKSLFEEATTVENTSRETIREAKNELIPKMNTAISKREEQVNMLIKLINKYGNDNVILCGDFNDTVGSYTLYRLHKECGLQQVYPEVGFGPMITYDAHNFTFRIDHILYRGNLAPYSMTRGRITASDHYPITATFIRD